jgi:hypothetical protein
MDNYFILSSKVGDKWRKVTSDMTSVNLGTCIHIVGELSSMRYFSQIPYEQGDDHLLDRHFSRRVHSDSYTHSVIQSMNP